MRATLTIAARDLRAAFESPLAYVLIAVFLLLTYGIFIGHLLSFSQVSEVLRMRAGQDDAAALARLSVQGSVVTPTISWECLLLMALIPLLTMRALADEKRQGTMELLLTAPISPASLIAGKFLGALGISVAAIVLTIGYPLTLIALATPDPGPVLTGFAGLLLVACVLTALGILASSLTDSTVVAAFLGFAFTAVVLLCGVLGTMTSLNAGIVLQWFSPLVHFASLSEGVVDTADLAYFAIATVAALFLALRVVDSNRWR